MQTNHELSSVVLPKAEFSTVTGPLNKGRIPSLGQAQEQWGYNLPTIEHCIFWRLKNRAFTIQ
jgi:hypothetical protein